MHPINEKTISCILIYLKYFSLSLLSILVLKRDRYRLSSTITVNSRCTKINMESSGNQTNEKQ